MSALERPVAAGAQTPVIAQPASAELVALYQFDEVADLGLDTSGNGNNVTTFGDGFTARVIKGHCQS